MKIPKAKIEDLKHWVESIGADWCGVQPPLTPETPTLLQFNSRQTGSTLAVPIDDYLAGTVAGDAIAFKMEKKLEASNKKFQEPKMTLKEKLYSVYLTLENIEKNGENESQHYDYLKAVDVVREIRKQLISIKVYAEVNFFFEGGPYTIARAKNPDAPFAARDCRCCIVFHDLETNEIATGSGLGTGADTGDKAIYKAQTGAFKYALKNAFMVPDGDAPDAESDPTVDENAEPDFETAKAAPRRTETRKETRKEEPARPPKAAIPDSVPTKADSGTATPAPATSPKNSSASTASTPATTSAPAATVAVPVTKSESAPTTAATSEPETKDMLDLPPNEEMLNEYRKRFRKLGDELAEGHLKSSKSLPVGRKLLVFMLAKAKVENAKDLTKRQWNDFFARVDAALANPEIGYAGLAKAINKENGIEEK